MNKRVKIITLITLIALIVIVAIIAINYLSEEDIVISINSQEVVLKKGEQEDTIDLETLNSEKDIIVKKISGRAKVTINGKELKNGKEVNLGILEINKNSKINIETKYINNSKANYAINTLPSTFPEYSVEGQSPYDGDYYITTFSLKQIPGHYIFKVNEIGKIVYYKRTEEKCFDFKKVKNSKGESRYTYLQVVNQYFEGITNEVLPCELVVLDENYQEIDRIKYLNKDNTEQDLENHTYIYLDDNHYILTSYVKAEKNINNKNIYALDCLIQEIKDGKTLWEFNSGNYLELYDYSTKENLDYSIPYQDYMHINWIDIDKDDGNIVCSFRNIDAILKINRKTGEKMWMISGIGDQFGMTEEQKFSKQHSIISIGNSTFLVFDNGNKNSKSRIVKFKIDEANKRIVEYKEYDLNSFSVMMGSVRLLDEKTETYLICHGAGIYDQHSIEEINYSTNETYFKFKFISPILIIYNVNKMP